MAAVIAGLIAEHVEEQPIHVVRFQRLGQNLHRLLAVVAAVDAGRIQAVVNDRLAVGFSKEPLGMGVVNCFVSLAEIEAADHADASRVALVKTSPNMSRPGRQDRAGVMEWHLGRIIGGDAAHAISRTLARISANSPTRCSASRLASV